MFFRRKQSLIIIQRVSSQFIYARALQLLLFFRRKNVIYDLDDADFLEKPPGTMFYFLKRCNKIQVGGRELEGVVKKINTNTFVNTSPVPDLGIEKSKKGEKLHIGWIGDFNGGHRQSMIELVFPAIRSTEVEIKFTLLGVGRKIKSDFNFIREYFDGNPKVELNLPENVDWKDESRIQRMISEFDIGIATLLDTELHRCKSGFKTKQYLNNGVPVLSSDVPENNRVVVDGVNGYLCNNPEEFAKAIDRIREMTGPDYAELSRKSRESASQFEIQRYLDKLITQISE